MSVWRDRYGDFWLFDSDGAAWILDRDEWDESGDRSGVEQAYGPLTEVALDDGDLIGMPPLPVSAA